MNTCSVTTTNKKRNNQAGSPLRRSLIPALKVSTSGGCGSGVTCQGSVFGNCCSQYNYW